MNAANPLPPHPHLRVVAPMRTPAPALTPTPAPVDPDRALAERLHRRERAALSPRARVERDAMQWIARLSGALSRRRWNANASCARTRALRITARGGEGLAGIGVGDAC